MRNWHSLYEILKFPLQVVLLAFVFCGIGNLIVNPSYGLCAFISHDILKMAGQIIQRTGTFMIVNSPVVFLISMVIKKGSSGITVVSAIVGYAAFLVTTMVAAPSTLTSNAYSSIFGLSFTTNYAFSSSVTKYPLQTGMIGVLIAAFITLFMFGVSRKKNEYGFFSFVSREMLCVIGTAVLCAAAGVVVSFVCPFFIDFFQRIIFLSLFFD